MKCSVKVCGPTIQRPQLTWEEGTYPIEGVYKNFNLPRVAKCSVENCSVPFDCVNFDLTQPFLFHCRREVRKVAASSLIFDQNVGKFKEVGDPLLIPEDYKGWFAVLGQSKEIAQEKAVPHFRQTAQLALSNCDRFLIGGSENIKALQVISREQELVHQPRILFPGDVLRMGKLYVAKTKIKSKGIFGKTSIKESRFLLCTDESDREVLIPIEMSGMFYILTTKSSRFPKVPILQMSKLCQRFSFPCVVKLVYGRVPATPCLFTGTMIMKECYHERSVIASTVANVKNILLEVPDDAPLMFLVAKNSPDLLGNEGYQNAIRLCREKADTYMRNIKVSYFVSSSLLDQTLQADDRSLTSEHHSIACNKWDDQIKQDELKMNTGISESESPSKTSSVGSFSSLKSVPCPKPCNLTSSLTESKKTEDNPYERPPPPRKVNNTVVSSDSEHYESLWRLANNKKGSLKKAPAPPPAELKPKFLQQEASLATSPSICLGIENDYLLFPVYLNDMNQSQQITQMTMSNQNWKSVLPQGQNESINQTRKEISERSKRKESFTFFEGYGSARSSSPHQPDQDPIYANIGNLREVLVEESELNNVQVCSCQSHPTITSDYNIPANIERNVPKTNSLPIIYDMPNCTSYDGSVSESCFDDLPLGVDSFSYNRKLRCAQYSVTDSGVDIDQEMHGSDKDDLSRMSGSELYLALKEIGIKQSTIDAMKEECIDGRLLKSLDEELLRDAFPNMREMELRKICKFIEGWRPKYT